MTLDGHLPMFPLGSVVFPHTLVPLRVFEPRYQALVDNVRAGDGKFGIVLIERGFEVGGGDVRFSTGTLVELLAVEDLDDGHRAIAVAGLERIVVDRWRDDNPHPWADVRRSPEREADGPVRIDHAVRALERVMLIASELGADVGMIDVEVSDDPVAASFQLSAIAPVQAMDQLGLLEAPDAASRIDRLIEHLDEQAELLRSRF